MADLAGLRVAYLGNFGPDHSTENELRAAFEDLGAEVHPLQEGRPLSELLLELAALGRVDLLLWTQTYGLAETGGTNAERLLFLEAMRAASIPTAGFHLDRWWGLDREGQVDEDAFFRVDRLFTADGGHDEQWADVGVNHAWLPPAVSRFECGPVSASARFARDVAFVGNWTGTYHPEWTHRRDLIRFLRNWTSRGRASLGLWPQRGHPSVRGDNLRALYASTKIVVGDSCLVGDRGHAVAIRYWSDRIPETIGRGGFLLHPMVEGLDEHFTDGVHYRSWDLGDWSRLGELIAHYLEDDAARREIAEAGRQHVLEHHTYHVRAAQIVADLKAGGLL